MKMILLIILLTNAQNLTYIFTMIYFCGHKVTDVIKKPLFSVSYIIFALIIYYIQNHDDAWVGAALIISLFLYYLMLKINIKVKNKEAIFNAVFGYLYVSIIESIILVIAHFTGLATIDTVTVNVGMTVLFHILPVLTYLSLKYIPVLKFISRIKLSQFVIALVTTVTIFFLTIAHCIIVGTTMMPMLPNEIAVVSLIIMIVLLILEEISDRNRDEQLYHYKTYLPIVEEMIKDIQVTQHSYSNRIMSVAGVIDSDSDISQMKESLKELLIPEKENYHFLDLENKLLSGLLYQKERYAKSIGINIDYDIKAYAFASKMNSYDIIDVTGRLIDYGIMRAVDTLYVTVGGEEKGFYLKAEYDCRPKDAKLNEGQDLIKAIKRKVKRCGGRVIISDSLKNGLAMTEVGIEVL